MKTHVYEITLTVSEDKIEFCCKKVQLTFNLRHENRFNICKIVIFSQDTNNSEAKLK